MKISQCMTRDVRVALADQPIRMAAEIMLAEDTGSIPVCEGDRLVGIVTDRDLAVRALAQGRGPETPVRDVMTEEVVFCFDDEDVSTAAQRMSESKVRRIPVVSRDGEKLIGILSLGDISQGDARLAEHALEGVTQPSSLHNQTAEGRV